MRHESSTSWSAYVHGSRIVFCDIFFQIFFSNIFLKKISSGNSKPAFISLGDDSNFFYEWQNILLRFLIRKENLIIGIQKRNFFHFSFPLFFFDFFFFPIYGVSTASGLGWTVSTEITTFVLLDDPSKSVFLSVISSSASAFVFYIGASITKIINWPSLIFFFVIFLTWHN